MDVCGVVSPSSITYCRLVLSAIFWGKTAYLCYESLTCHLFWKTFDWTFWCFNEFWKWHCFWLTLRCSQGLIIREIHIILKVGHLFSPSSLIFGFCQRATPVVSSELFVSEVLDLVSATLPTAFLFPHWVNYYSASVNDHYFDIQNLVKWENSIIIPLSRATL